MGEGKTYLVDDVERHLNKSSYVFLADYHRVTVPEVSSLRESLSKLGAEFHVVKNTALRHAVARKELPEMDEHLAGPTAIVTGGDSPSEVAKVLITFHKKQDEKCAVKVAILDGKSMNPAEVKALSELPSLPEMRAKFLALLSTPAQQMVSVCAAGPKSLLNVLQAKIRS